MIELKLEGVGTRLLLSNRPAWYRHVMLRNQVLFGPTVSQLSDQPLTVGIRLLSLKVPQLILLKPTVVGREACLTESLVKPPSVDIYSACKQEPQNDWITCVL